MDERVFEQLDRIERNSLLAAKKALRIEDVAILTGLSKSCLYKLTFACQIPHYKTGKQLYFEKSEIEAWMLQNKVSSKKEISQTADEYIMNKKMRGS